MSGITEIYITEGNYRVADFKYPGGSYLSVQHYCTAGRAGSDLKGWVGQYYQHTQFEEPCYICGCTPPEGIQAVFCMMNWDKPMRWSDKELG